MLHGSHVGPFRAGTLNLAARSELGLNSVVRDTRSKSVWQAFVDMPKFERKHPVVTGKLYTLYAHKMNLGDTLF